MKRVLKTGLIAALLAMIAVGTLEAVFARTQNDLFQFCTTKAYGWPAPWRIDYCECEGARTVHPTSSKLVNLSIVGGSGLLGFTFVGGLSLWRRRPF